MALAEPPFRFGQIVSQQHFVGRESELAALVTDLSAGVNVVVIAPRRYGKSSLVVRALDELTSAGVRGAYLDLERTPSKERFASHLAHAMYDGLLAVTRAGAATGNGVGQPAARTTADHTDRDW